MTASRRISDYDIRLIPKPLWGVSLASVCLASSWEPIRQQAILANAGNCYFADEVGRHDGTLEAHERWEYDLKGKVTLTAIWPLCPHCHELFHPGRVLARSGQAGLDRLTRRYAETAGIPFSTAQRRYHNAFRNHSLASAVRTWSIDTSAVSQHFPLKAKKAKEAQLSPHRWVPNPFQRGKSDVLSG